VTSGIVSQRRRHVEQLCIAHQITAETQPPGISHGRADPVTRRVLIPAITMVRRYYIALHEIGHCVLGWDSERAKAPQEAETWQWAIAEAIEPPTAGHKRMIFNVMWGYLLHDLAAHPTAQQSNAELFPDPDHAFWSFLASLDDDAGRLLYQAAKITARGGPPEEARREVQRALAREQQHVEEAAERIRAAVHSARVEEQLRTYGPPQPARPGERALLGSGAKAHVWARAGLYGALATYGEISCGASGVAHPAPAGTDVCRTCKRISTQR
jgi:hypothetical protein